MWLYKNILLQTQNFSIPVIIIAALGRMFQKPYVYQDRLCEIAASIDQELGQGPGTTLMIIRYLLSQKKILTDMNQKIDFSSGIMKMEFV